MPGGMRRADRRSDSDDNAASHLRSQRLEPVSYHELKSSLVTVRAQKTELQQRVQETAEQAEQNYQLYLEEQQQRQTALTLYQSEQQKYQSTLTLYQKEQHQRQATFVLFREEQQKYQTTLTLHQEGQQKYQTTLTLYQEEQQKYQSTLTLYREVQTQTESYLTLYNQEQTRSSDLLVKFEAAETGRQNYLTLYTEAQTQLKLERRSKAGIKGWETRRKRENERLKQEIGEMTVFLRDSLARKEEAVNHLDELAERMDRIQCLVDSVDEESTSNPLGLLQKFNRIWRAVKGILAE